MYQVWAEWADRTGAAQYYEQRTNRHQRMEPFETGHEDFMIGGWVLVLVSVEKRQRERVGIELTEPEGLVRQHGSCQLLDRSPFGNS